MDIEAELDRIIDAVSKLSDEEKYIYPIPEEWRKYLSCVHVQRPYGLAVWDGAGRVIVSRTVLSPKRMRKVLRRIMRQAEAHDSVMAYQDAPERKRWGRLWGE